MARMQGKEIDLSDGDESPYNKIGNEQDPSPNRYDHEYFHIPIMFRRYWKQEYNHVYRLSTGSELRTVYEKINLILENIDNYGKVSKRTVSRYVSPTMYGSDSEVSTAARDDNDDCDMKEEFTIACTFLDHKLILLFEFCGPRSMVYITMFYATETDSVAEIKRMLIGIIPTKVRTKRKFGIICHNGREFYVKNIKLKPEKTELSTFYDHYNEDFEETSEHILKILQNDNKGLVLLYGDAGTGKTSYLRYIINTLEDKQIVYLPPDMTHALSKPELITFLMDYPNSVLLIEDAENVLKERQAGDHQSVSNILNITDGLLGNALKFQVICTFNSGIDHIDLALRRPGRLIASYHFKKLTVDKADKLIKKIHGEHTNATEDMTLAEIFNYTAPKHTIVHERYKAGFV